MSNNDILLVNEIFGPTFQGEGPSLGRQATFLRLAMCNLKCTWCDTRYTWDWQRYNKSDEVHVMSFTDLQFKIMDHRGPYTDMLVVSGGEPMLQGVNLARYLKQDWNWGRIEFETNGTILPPRAFMDIEDPYNYYHFNVSPKLGHSGNEVPKALKWRTLKTIHDNYKSIFKFVIRGERDLNEVETIRRIAELDNERIWIMPEGTTRFDIDQTMNNGHLANEVLERGWNLTTRLHVQLWEATRAK